MSVLRAPGFFCNFMFICLRFSPATFEAIAGRFFLGRKSCIFSTRHHPPHDAPARKPTAWLERKEREVEVSSA